MKYHKGPLQDMEVSGLAGLVLVIFIYCMAPFIFIPQDQGEPFLWIMVLGVVVVVLAQIFGAIWPSKEMPKVLEEDDARAKDEENTEETPAKRAKVLALRFVVVLAAWSSCMIIFSIMGLEGKALYKALALLGGLVLITVAYVYLGTREKED